MTETRPHDWCVVKLDLHSHYRVRWLTIGRFSSALVVGHERKPGQGIDMDMSFGEFIFVITSVESVMQVSLDLQLNSSKAWAYLKNRA